MSGAIVAAKSSNFCYLLEGNYDASSDWSHRFKGVH